MATLLAVVGGVLAVFGAFCVIFGLYGIKRTHDVRPRAQRPELASVLYPGFAGVALVGLLWLVIGVGLVLR